MGYDVDTGGFRISFKHFYIELLCEQRIDTLTIKGNHISYIISVECSVDIHLFPTTYGWLLKLLSFPYPGGMAVTDGDEHR